MAKDILFSAYSMDFGGIETALITLLKEINNKYNITLVLEKKEGIFLKDLPENINVITYKPSNNKNIIFRKIVNFFKQQKFKLKYKNKFDFSASFATYSYSSSFVARNASKNSCLWVHNDYFNFFNKNIEEYKKFFKKLKVDKYKKIVFVSKNDQNTFLKFYPEYMQKCTYCNNLIDYNKILQKSKEKIADFKKLDNIVTFINIGRHDEKQKRLSRIINASKKLHQEGHKFNVVFVGDGKDSKMYQELAKEDSEILFLGVKKNPYFYLAKSDCLIMSSDYEGYPVVFIESLILGKPIITTDVSDAKKDVEGKYGIVVGKSEEEIYNGMKQYLENRFVSEKFDPEKFNKEILEKLEKIINN